jgi:hypothetical protein
MAHEIGPLHAATERSAAEKRRFERETILRMALSFFTFLPRLGISQIRVREPAQTFDELAHVHRTKRKTLPVPQHHPAGAADPF